MVEEFFLLYGGDNMAKWVDYEKKENLLSMIDGHAVLREKDSTIFENSIKRLQDLATILE